MFLLRPLVFVLGLVLVPCLAFADEIFELTVEGRPDLTSQAQMEGSRLLIKDATGSTFKYDRHSPFDTPDGELLGFRSLTAGAALRWPALGGGRMWLADLGGTMWRMSLQSVNRIGGVALPLGTPTVLGPGGIACLHTPPGAAAWVAHVGSDGRMRCYQGSAAAWKYRELPLKTSLIPGAPLAMYPTPGAWPGILTVGPDGRLLSIVDGTVVQPLSTTIKFPLGAHVELLQIGPHGHAFAVDIQGRLWDLDVETHLGTMVEPAVGAFPPGAPLAVLMDGTIPVVTAVNNASIMVAYGRLAGGWSPATVAAGFTPGTHVSTATLNLAGTPIVYVAAVNWAGQLQLWQKGGPIWSVTTIPGTLLAPGSPVEIGQAYFGPLLSAIGADGVWHTWSFGMPGGWAEHSIGPGYTLGAPMAILPVMGTVFTVDTTGRLLMAYFDARGWNVGYALPTLDYSPQLVSRRIVPNPELPPATVQFLNSSEDDLILQIVDQFQPRQPDEIKIPKRGEATRSLERDAGSQLEEVYLVPGPAGTLIERTETSPIPPQQRYTLVAWSNKVTYRYIDRRKNKPPGVTPSFDLKTHVSLGVIAVPPGAILQDGETLDIPAIAKQTNNPGAARFFPQPVAPPVTIEVPKTP